MKGPRGPFQTSIEINVKNLVVTSDPRKLIKWDPEYQELCDTTISYSLQCAQRERVTVKLTIYSVEGWKVMELTNSFIYPDKTGDTIDLAPFFWTWRYNPITGDFIPLPKGLYTFDVQVVGASPYDQDRIRSGALLIPDTDARLVKVGSGLVPIELMARTGIIHSGYCLCSDKDANQVIISFYDPIFRQPIIYSPEYPLNYRKPCVRHEVVFTGRLDYAGKYWVVVEAQDDHPESNKAHERRWALPLAGTFIVPSCANFAFTDDVNTSSDAQNAYQQLGLIWDPNINYFSSCYSGFYPLGIRGGVVINATKEIGMVSLQKDAVFSYTHHAWYYWLPAFTPEIRIEDIQSLPDGALSQLLLAVLSGCKTAATTDDRGNPVYNITQAIVDKGAKVAVGFRESPFSFPTMMYFNERLWYYLTKNGNNVTAAVHYAKEDTEARYGRGKSGDPIRIGDGTTVLYPARWAQ